MNRENKKNLLVILGLLILTAVFILDKLIDINAYVAVGLGIVSLICFIIYLVSFFKDKK